MQKTRIDILPNKGRGIIACTSFEIDELIEKVPIILIPDDQYPIIEKSVFQDYTFSWGLDPEHHALALGHGSLYNHSYEPNARYIKDLEAGWIEFIAIRPIQVGEEITINYNGDPLCQDPLWFSVSQ